jgi:hypothetical protein
METNNNEVLEQKSEEVIESSQVIQENITNESVKTKKPKTGLVIALIICTLLVVGCVFAAVTIGFQSNGDKFLNLVLNKQILSDIASDYEEATKSSEQINTEASFNIDTLLKTALMEDVKLGDVSLNNSSVIKENGMYSVVTLNVEDEEIIKFEAALNKDVLGIKLGDLLNEFIAVRNKDLKELAENLAGDSEGVPNRILTEKEILAAMKLNKSDLLRIMTKYENAIGDAIKNNVKIEKDVEIEIGGNKIKTTRYTLDITEKVAQDMTMNILLVVKNDSKDLELLRADLCSILELYEDAGYELEFKLEDVPEVSKIVEEASDLYDDLKSEIDDYSKEEIQELIDNKLMQVSLYVNSGKVVMNEMTAQDSTISIGALKVKNEFFVDTLVDSEYESMILRYSGKQEKNNGNTIINGKLSFELDNGDEKIESDLLQINQEFLQKAELQYVELNDQNAYILNDKETKEMQDKFAEISEKIPDFLGTLDSRLRKAIGEDNYNKLSTLFTSPEPSYTDTYNNYDYNDSNYNDYEYDFDDSDYNYDYLDSQATSIINEN